MEIDLIGLLLQLPQRRILDIILGIENVAYWLKALEIIVIDVLEA